VHCYTESRRIGSRLLNTVAFGLESPLIPGGEAPIIFCKASGAYLKDVDGRTYIDFSNGLGSVLLGHNDPDVNGCLVECLQGESDVLAGPSELHAEVAEQITRDLASDFGVVFFSSGTAAVRAGAAMLARITGRKVILSAGYHGWDPFWGAGPDILVPNVHGTVDFFFCLDYLHTLIARHNGEIAGVVFSPDYLYLDKAWYDEFFAICRKAGIHTLADEVKQGYRYGAGSSLVTVGQRADLCTFGKCLANGHLLACVAAPKPLLKYARDLVNTGFIERLPFVAAKATLDKIKRLEVQAQIRKHGDTFLAGISERLKASRLPIEIKGVGNLFQFVIGDQALEKAFYEEAIVSGLVLFAGDNQTPSYALMPAVVTEALQRISGVILRLETRFCSLRDVPVPQQARWLAAWRTMEGFPEKSVFEADRRRFLRLYALGVGRDG
jgi:glutamate-1-semialdehyde aminotransferase